MTEKKLILWQCDFCNYSDTPLDSKIPAGWTLLGDTALCCGCNNRILESARGLIKASPRPKHIENIIDMIMYKTKNVLKSILIEKTEPENGEG